MLGRGLCRRRPSPRGRPCCGPLRGPGALFPCPCGSAVAPVGEARASARRGTGDSISPGSRLHLLTGGREPEARPGGQPGREPLPGAAVTPVLSPGSGCSFQTSVVRPSPLRHSWVNHLPLVTESLGLEGGPWGCQCQCCDHALIFPVAGPSPERQASTKSRLMTRTQCDWKCLVWITKYGPFWKSARFRELCQESGTETNYMCTRITSQP